MFLFSSKRTKQIVFLGGLRSTEEAFLLPNLQLRVRIPALPRCFLAQFVKKIEIEPIQCYAVDFTNVVQSQVQQKVGYFANAGLSILGYLGYTHSVYIQQCHMTTGLQRSLQFHTFKAIRYLTSTRQRMKQLQNCHKSNIIFQSKVGQGLYVRSNQVLLMQGSNLTFSRHAG